MLELLTDEAEESGSESSEPEEEDLASEPEEEEQELVMGVWLVTARSDRLRLLQLDRYVRVRDHALHHKGHRKNVSAVATTCVLSPNSVHMSRTNATHCSVVRAASSARSQAHTALLP